jgi:hypothetical protein
MHGIIDRNPEPILITGKFFWEKGTSGQSCDTPERRIMKLVYCPVCYIVSLPQSSSRRFIEGIPSTGGIDSAKQSFVSSANMGTTVAVRTISKII